MKKVVLGFICLSVLSLAACSSDKEAAKSTDNSTSKQETKVTSSKAKSTTKETTAAKQEKEMTEKQKADQAEKEKQALITQAVTAADAKMKTAEATPSDDTYAAAKSAIEAIPGGNSDLQARLATVEANLAATKQQATATSTQQTTQTQPAQAQNETYEQLKQRTLQSTPADRTNWSNKEWEAFGMALAENSLAMDDAGNIISQAQKEQQIKEENQSSSQEETSNRTVTSPDQAVSLAQSTYGDNNGAWTWGCLSEDDRGYFVKASDPNDGTMTHTAKSVFVHYDGSITEN